MNFLQRSQILAVLLVATGCGGEPATTPDATDGGAAAAPAGGEEAEHGHLHGDRVHLGAVDVGGTRIDVYQVVDLVPGQEGDFDLDFAAGTALPTVRGWVGDETGRGSLKVRFEKETATRMHGHPEVPDSLAADASLWLDVEGVGRAAIEVQR